MMDAADFMSLALKLSQSAGEAERRTAVSRAYYSAFHIAKQLVESCGVRFSSAGATHDKLPFCLAASQDNSLVAASRRLNALRMARNVADYDLADEECTTAYVNVQLTKARDVVTALLNAEQDILAIREPIQDYARNVLRMTIHESDS